MPINLKTGKEFPRGLIPTPRYKLAFAMPFRPVKAPVGQAAWVPSGYSPDGFGNFQYGICVTAANAFKVSCSGPKTVLATSVVEKWAQDHGVLNGADLLSVIQMLQQQGFPFSGGAVGDGAPLAVDFSQEAVLQAAIDQGPVNIGIDANALPSGAGNQQGWFALSKVNANNEDHSVELAAYGTAQWCFQQFGFQLPAGLDPATKGYMLYTWSTVGFVSHDWLMGCCAEAWLRNPNNTWQGTGPQPWTDPVPPGPGPGPNPPPPTPTPVPLLCPIVLSGHDGIRGISLSGTLTLPSQAGAQSIWTLVLAALAYACANPTLFPPQVQQFLAFICPFVPRAIRQNAGE